MAKLYRVISYVLDLNGNCESDQELISQIENNKYPEFHHVREVDCVELCEWSDDHPANRTDCDFSIYFSGCSEYNI
jgi:hypothetical protein